MRERERLIVTYETGTSPWQESNLGSLNFMTLMLQCKLPSQPPERERERERTYIYMDVYERPIFENEINHEYKLSLYIVRYIGKPEILNMPKFPTNSCNNNLGFS